MQVSLANPRGFCAGVDRAIDIVNRALEIFGTPVYVRHEVVHNKIVVDDLKSRGAIFVDELDEVPESFTRRTQSQNPLTAIRGQVGIWQKWGRCEGMKGIVKVKKEEPEEDFIDDDIPF